MQPRGNLALYQEAVELHHRAYRKLQFSKKHYDERIGYMLLNLFGKGFWTLKDLDDTQLAIVIRHANHKIEKRENYHEKKRS